MLYTSRLGGSRSWSLFVRSAVFLLVSLGLPTAGAAQVQVQVQGPDGLGVAGVAVYLESQDAGPVLSASAQAIDITQKNKGFSPYLSVIQAGTRITFSNSDDITHHIYSLSAEDRFSYVISAGEATSEMAIDHPGIIAMGCNIHDWMSGHILVLATPYYAISDEHGRAVFQVADAGSYRLSAWHPQMQEPPSKILELSRDQRVSLQLAHKLGEIPAQQGVDDFDFLEGY